jgi:hypothetical protein
MSEGVGAVERGDFLRASHDNGEEEEDCCCSSCVGVGLFFSASKSSKNFWISGSVFWFEFEFEFEFDEGVGSETEVEVVDVVGGVFPAGVAVLFSEGVEDHSQPIVKLCKW